MKNFLLVTLVIGICIRNSIGKENLKIDLPENFQADFMKTFARVMRSDYPNCDINPEEVLFKIGVEFLKRGGASGLDINLEDNSRSKRAIGPEALSLVTKLKDKLGKRSIENDDEPTPAETNERQKRFIPKHHLKSKIGHLVTKLKSQIGLGKVATKLKTKIGLGKVATKLKTKIGLGKVATKLKTKIGLGKVATKLKTKIGLGKVATKLKTKIGLGKVATKLKSKIAAKKLTSKTGLEALAAKLNVGQIGVISEELSQERRRRAIFTGTPKLKSKVGLLKRVKLTPLSALKGGHGKRSIDDNVWTPQDEAVAKRSIETDDAEIDQNREQRSAYEMLMDSVDEVKVNRNADFDQEIAKRKRRNALDLLMDTAQSRNMEF